MTTKVDRPDPKSATQPRFDGRTAIIAGNGALPVAVVSALRASGNNPLVLAIRGEASGELYQGDFTEIEVVELGRVVKLLKNNNIRNVVLAGGVRQRPKLRSIKPDFATLAVVPRFFRTLGQGDDRLLRAVIGVLESYGFRVIGAHQIVPDLLTPSAGQITTAKPDDRDTVNIALAREAALTIGHLDVGQGAVAVGGRVVALEGAEGTDAMLERIEDMRRAGRIPQSGGVLVKCAKPSQDERADLPAIGVDTVINAKRARLSGIAVEAGKTLILDFGTTVETANKLGIFITSFPSKET